MHIYNTLEIIVIVSADKVPYNIVFVCKSHYIDGLIKELGIDNSLCSPTYTPTTLTNEEILDNHRSGLCSELEFTSYFSMVTLCVKRLMQMYFIPNCPFGRKQAITFLTRGKWFDLLYLQTMTITTTMTGTDTLTWVE